MWAVRRWVWCVSVATMLAACATLTPEQRAARVQASTDQACHLIGDYLTHRASTGGTALWFAREKELEQQLRHKVDGVRAGDTAQHDAIAEYIKDTTRRVSEAELDAQYVDPNGRTRFQAMLAACDTLVPDVRLTALNARLVEEVKRRYG